VDLDPDDDQRALQETIRRFAADHFPMEVVRAWSGDGGLVRRSWTALADLGTFGIAVPEERGGAGLGTPEAVLVHEVLGGQLAPGPLVAASLAATLVEGVMDGVVAPAVLDTSRGADLLVEHLPGADILLTLSSGAASVVPVEVLQFDVVARPTDPTTPVARLASLPEGEVVATGEELARLRMLGSLLTSAQLVGGSEASTALAVAYAAEREQFGRPIGSFQGLKHLLADSYVRTEVARSALWAAAVTLDEPDAGDAARAVAGARVLAARAAMENAKTCIQVHGGMGFTWEVDAHLYLKRAIVLESGFDSPDRATELVAHTLSGAG
jgi:alkylation response protein AidB-like acyl-CoA dehydrogenase